MNRAKSRQRWRRRSPRAAGLPGISTTREHQPDARDSGLARTRSGLQRAAFLLVLLLFPVGLALLLAAGQNDPSDSVGVRLQEQWGPLIPVVLGLPAAVLLAAAWAVRFLPGGREAAELAPMLRRNRGSGPRPVSVGALVALITLLVFIPGMGADAYQGVRALSGDGLVLTVGEDTYVTHTEESSGRGGGTNYFLDTPYGEAIAEGDPSDGDRYGVYPPDAHRAWKIGLSGWLISSFTWLLVLAGAAGAFLLGRASLRRARARRRWLLAGRTRSGLAMAYGAGAALLALATSTWVVVDEATDGGTRATLAIPGAEDHELSSFWVRDAEGRHPYHYAEDDAVAAPLQSRRLNENRDHELGLLDVWATVTRYPTAEDAERAAQLWLDEQQGEPLRLADGTEGRWDADTTGAAAASTRGSVLVTVDIDDWSWEEEPEEVVARLQRQVPEIRDLLAGSSERILDVELPWWG